jgi:hypothetical protein
MARLIERDGAPAQAFRSAINALVSNPKPADAERYGSTGTYIFRRGIHSATYRVDGGNNVAIHLLVVRGRRI